MDEVTIRRAVRGDCAQLRGLIQELADYEKMPDGPKIDMKTLEEDGFGEHPYYHCFVAENKDSILVGFTLYFYTYSTWEGKSVYMEDLYVNPSFRHKKIGTNLWKSVVKAGLEKGCTRCNFAVLDWNTPSINFYKANGAVNLTQAEGWQAFRMDLPTMQTFANKAV